jgi:hypothetical protein
MTLSELGMGQMVARYAPGGRLLAMIVGGSMSQALTRPVDRDRLWASQDLQERLGNIPTEAALRWAAESRRV